MDHTPCPKQTFACGCITGCILEKFVNKCSLHKFNFGDNYTLVQFPCGCLVSEDGNGYIHRDIQMICGDHFSNYTNNLALLTALYMNRCNITFHSKNLSPCYGIDPDEETCSECSHDSNEWIWDAGFNRAVHIKEDLDDVEYDKIN